MFALFGIMRLGCVAERATEGGARVGRGWMYGSPSVVGTLCKMNANCKRSRGTRCTYLRFRRFCYRTSVLASLWPSALGSTYLYLLYRGICCSLKQSPYKKVRISMTVGTLSFRAHSRTFSNDFKKGVVLN